MPIPKDPVILLSFINLKLRDEYSDLNDLCLGLNLDQEELCEQLGKIDYKYEETSNQFK